MAAYYPSRPLPCLLHRDPSRLFLYKPPGLPVFPPHKDPEGSSLLRWWLQNGGFLEGWPPGFEGGIAHRLDTRTDGLMVVASSPATLLELRREFSEGLLRKIYRFESRGDVSFRNQRCTLPIAHHARKSDRMVVQKGRLSDHRGKWYPAWTEFSWLEGNTWQAEIRTGVMHQIRVHAAAMGIPLDGDSIYGGAVGEFRLQHVGIKAEGWSFFLPV